MDNTLSNFDIENILKSMGLKLNGIFSKDDLPELQKGFYIVNLEAKNDGNGTHWTTFYFNDKNDIWYFDAFGFPPPVEVQNNFNEYGFNDKQIQDLNSTACGYYCIGFIKYMTNKNDNKKTFEKFINIFSNDTKKNDYILKKYLNLKKPQKVMS